MDIERRSAITPDDFQSIISISIDGFLIVNLDGSILETNDSYCQMIGYSRDELLKLQLPAIDAVDKKEDVARRVELIMQNGSLRFETKHRHKDGTVIDVEVSANYSTAHGGSVFSFVRNISTQKHYREIMAARLRLIEFSLTHSLDELLRQTLDEAEALTGSCIGFYHFKDPDSQMLILQTWSTKTATIFCKAEGAGSHYPVSQAGVWVDCIRERRPVIHNDYASLTHKKGMPDGHATVIRELVVPIFRNDKIVAIMGVGNKTTDYNQQDMDVISTLADLAWDVAEHKKVEQSLQYERDLSMDIINTQPTGIYRIRVFAQETWEKDAWRSFKKSPYIFELASEPFCKILGTTMEVLENNPGIVFQIIHGDDREGCVKKNEEAAVLLKEFFWEGRLIIDGVIKWVRFQSLPRPLENGDVLWTGSLTDITERKQAEVAVKEVEQRQAKMIENISDVIVIIDQNGINKYESPNVEKCFGWKPEELVGAKACDNVHPDDLEEAQVFLSTLINASGASGTTECRYLCKDGSYKWIEITLVNLLDDPDIRGILGDYHDISERKQIEEVQSYLLQVSSHITGEDFFEALALYLAKTLDMDYVCIDRLQGDLLSAKTLAVYNDGHFEDVVEYTLKDTPCGDVVGKEVCVFPREVCSLFPLDKALQDLQAESYVGTTLWSFDMKPIGLIAVIGRNELLNSHFAETVLKLVAIRAAGELERRQAEEEKLVVQQQLQHAQKLESLGVLAGGIAHDFNNILAIIIGNCSLAEMNPNRAIEHISIIEKAADRAAGLCRQMLAYAGKAMSTMTQVNMAALVDEMVQMLTATISRNVVIKHNLSPDIPTFNGDASQLRQIVMNLIMNASEAIGEVQGVVQVSLIKTEILAEQPVVDHLGNAIPPGWYARLEVSDNGCGMDEETRGKIFEPFYTTKFAGRGLGMSAALGIIKAHNGALQLESRLGQGTSFKVYLPVQISKSETEEAQQKTASALWHGSGTILLAEDEVQVKSIAILLLQELGFTVLDAANGKEALELYQQNATDISLVITDMGMPVMNGYELFYKLKQLNPKLPIIISSGFGESDISSKIPREAIAGMINKPYNFAHLREVLKGVVEGAQ